VRAGQSGICPETLAVPMAELPHPRKTPITHGSEIPRHVSPVSPEIAPKVLDGFRREISGRSSSWRRSTSQNEAAFLDLSGIPDKLFPQ